MNTGGDRDEHDDGDECQDAGENAKSLEYVFHASVFWSMMAVRVMRIASCGLVKSRSYWYGPVGVWKVSR